MEQTDTEIFLSTPSARRATFELRASIDNITYFYPRPPRGGRPRLDVVVPDPADISIHALREEGDVDPALRRRHHRRISIHALREEGDLVIQPFGQTLEDFYPRPPRGGRPSRARPGKSSWSYFYPRPPRGGRRSQVRRHSHRIKNFYPRPPRGGRQGSLTGSPAF